MRKSILSLFVAATCLLTASCSSKPKSTEDASGPNYEKHFAGLDGCFLLYDLRSNELIDAYNRPACKRRKPACSTFKVPLAVMAFESGVLKDENVTFKWDGVERSVPEWNKDHDATSWMKDSVVWYSQRLTPKLGRKRIQKYLVDFNYGNQSFSGDLEAAWLTPAPFLKKRPKTSVMVSAYDQLDFLKKLFQRKLPVSERAQQLTVRILPEESSARGFTLAGKTGSGFVGPRDAYRLGWYVAHLEGHGQEYLAAVTFQDNQPNTKGFAGMQSKQIMKAILEERGLW